MHTLESLRSRLHSAEQMLSVVKTMKILASTNIRDYEHAVEALALYAHTIELGLQIALADQKPVELTEPLKGHHLGAIIFGSDQGLAGQFNERVAAYTLSQINTFDDDWRSRRVMAIGRRVTGYLTDGGIHVTEEMGVPGSLEGVLGAVRRVLFRVDRWRTRYDVERLVLFGNAPTSSAAYKPHMRWILPVDPVWLGRLQQRAWDSRTLPFYNISTEHLLSGLIQQLLFVMLYRAFAESLASENASRLRSMQMAERNIEDRIIELRTQYQHRRQSEITDELLDITSGFEALLNKG